MGDYYILQGKETKEVSDVIEWAESFDRKHMTVDRTEIGEVTVSTVFLGLNHSLLGGPPLLFETMIFGGDHDQYQDRYTTWDEAVEGHKKACELVRG